MVGYFDELAAAVREDNLDEAYLGAIAERYGWRSSARSLTGTSEKTCVFCRLSLDPTTVDALREHRHRQLEERMMIGPGWQEEQRDHQRADS